MTKGEDIQNTYAATLSRMKAQPGRRSKLGMEVLMWVLHAERPLHVDELCHALGVEKGSTDLNIRNIPTLETLLACSQGLVTVEKSSSTVRLVHYTLQEYLSRNPNQCSQPSRPDARAKRPNLRKTAVLVVDGRALQSLVRRVLPVVLCRARPSPIGPCRARPSSVGPCRARPTSMGPCRARQSTIGPSCYL